MIKTLAIFLILPCLVLAQGQRIITRPQQERNYFDNSIFLSQGPSFDLPKIESDTVVEYAFRVIITAQSVHSKGTEGYNLYIEQFTFGTEGCCRHFVQVVRIEPADIMKSFQIDGEPWNLKFVKWLSGTSFLFDLANIRFKMSSIDKETVVVSKLK